MVSMGETMPEQSVNTRPFDTSLLDAALERQRKDRERERQRVIKRILRLLDQWGPDYGIQRAYLFGSVARPGRFRPDSDLDLAVEQIDHLVFFKAIGEFSSEIGRPVDLVELEQCHFADKIRQEGIPWTQSN